MPFPRAFLKNGKIAILQGGFENLSRLVRLSVTVSRCISVSSHPRAPHPPIPRYRCPSGGNSGGKFSTQ
jgi:hypothetical protein